MAIEFAEFLYDGEGTAIEGATVELFDRNTTTPVRASTTTNAAGYWTITHATEGRFDVRVTSGSSVRFTKYDAAVQMEELEAKEIHLRNPANTFSIDLVPGAVTANRILNVPVITGTDTLATLGLAATFSAIMTHSADIIIQDDSDLAIGTSSDNLLRWSTGDASAHTLVLGLNDTNQTLHITDVGAIATDWGASNLTHPEVLIHSNTDTSTDYLRLGGHDGTTAYIDNVGGTTLAFQIAGTSELTLTATLLSPVSDATTDLGTTSVGFNDLHLGSGGIINLDGGDVLLTHSANFLTMTGGSFRVDGNVGTNRAPTTQMDAYVADSGTTTVVRTIKAVHASTGTPDAGLGVGIQFEIDKGSGGSVTTAGRMDVLWNKAPNAGSNEDADWVLSLRSSGTTGEKVRILDTGSMSFAQASTILCTSATMTFGSSGQQIDVANGSVKLTMGTASTFGTTQPTNAIVCRAGTAPAGAITTASGIFASTSVLRKIIADGTVSNVG